MRVAAFVPDLMDRSRFDRHEIAFVRTAEQALASGASLILVDIDACKDLGQFRLDGVTIIGFGSHVAEDRHVAAQAAGFDEVLARSVFFRRLDDLVGS